MSTISTLAETTRSVISKNSTTILAAVAVSGVVATTVLAVRATPRALGAIHEATPLDFQNAEFLPLTRVEKVKVAWKFYIPTAVIGTATIACIIGGNTISTRRTAALASAYTLADTAIKEYQSKVVEVIGENKELKIRDAIAQDRLDANPVTANNLVHVANGGEVLFYDTVSGRYFKSDIETLRRAENTLNQRLLNSSYVSLNEMYSEIGLDETKLGDDMGWVPDNMLEFRFSARLASDNTPCVVLDYKIDPKMDWRAGLH